MYTGSGKGPTEGSVRPKPTDGCPEQGKQSLPFTKLLLNNIKLKINLLFLNNLSKKQAYFKIRLIMKKIFTHTIITAFLVLFCLSAIGKSFSLQFLNKQIIKPDVFVQGVRVGGFSDIDYHKKSRTFFILSDDKGKFGSPRFYHFKLKKILFKKKYQLQIKKQSFLLNQLPIDPEGIVVTQKNQVIVSTDGFQLQNKDITHPVSKNTLYKTAPFLFLQAPELLSFSREGKLLSYWTLPKVYWPSNLKNLKHFGAKDNQGFEALSIDPKHTVLWSGLESHLMQDMVSRNTQNIRIQKWDIATKNPLLQFTYPAPFIITQNKLSGQNGLTSFIALKNQQFLAIHRAYLLEKPIQSHLHYTQKKLLKNKAKHVVSLNLIDCGKAGDVSHYKSLNNKKFKACKTIQTMNLTTFLQKKGIRIDNIEGLTFGPQISKSKKLLVLVSDNDFHKNTQVLFFTYQTL